MGIFGSGKIGNGSALALVNQKNGVIGSGGTLHLNLPAGVTNQGVMLAQCGTTLQFDRGTTVANSGTIEADNPALKGCSASQVFVLGTISNAGNFIVDPGSLFQISGKFTNFAGTALSGGTYTLNGGTLQFNDANIVTNGARITLFTSQGGSAPAIIDQSGNNGLRNFSAISAKGSLSIINETFVTLGNLTNAGTLIIGGFLPADLKVSGLYTQTEGITRLNAGSGLSAAPDIDIQNGTFLGTGVIVSPMVSSGIVIPGPGPIAPGTLTEDATYTQNAGGSLTINMSFSECGLLSVVGEANLNGTLNVKLRNGFVPTIGSTFTILTSRTAVTGRFATVNGLSINGSEHFAITYTATSVILTVESGA